MKKTLRIKKIKPGLGGRLDNFDDFVAYSPDGNYLVGVSDEGTIRLWELETGKLKRKLSGHKWLVSSLAFSPDGKTFATGSWDGTILLWEVPKKD